MKQRIIETIEDNNYIITKQYLILARQSDGAFIPKTIETIHTYNFVDIINDQVVLIHMGSSSDGQISEPQHTFIDLNDLRVTNAAMYDWAKGFKKTTDN